MKRTTLALALLLSVSLALVGCSRNEPRPVAKGDRIVSLAPNLTEIIFAVGGDGILVGRTTSCNYPPDKVKGIPIVGDFGNPSLESLVFANPTLVLEVDLADEVIGRKMDDIGLKRKRIPCRKLADIPVAIRTVGGLVHREIEANMLADSVTTRLREEVAKSAMIRNRPRVFIEIWGDPIISAGNLSFIAELVRLAGGHNIGDGIDKAYFQASSEWVISQNPDVILCLWNTAKTPARKVIVRRAGWDSIPAVRNGRICDDINLDLLTRPSPRVVEGITALRARLENKGKP